MQGGQGGVNISAAAAAAAAVFCFLGCCYFCDCPSAEAGDKEIAAVVPWPDPLALYGPHADPTVARGPAGANDQLHLTGLLHLTD